MSTSATEQTQAAITAVIQFDPPTERLPAPPQKFEGHGECPIMKEEPYTDEGEDEYTVGIYEAIASLGLGLAKNKLQWALRRFRVHDVAAASNALEKGENLPDECHIISKKLAPCETDYRIGVREALVAVLMRLKGRGETKPDPPQPERPEPKPEASTPAPAPTEVGSNGARPFPFTVAQLSGEENPYRVVAEAVRRFGDDLVFGKGKDVGILVQLPAATSDLQEAIQVVELIGGGAATVIYDKDEDRLLVVCRSGEEG